MSVTKVWRWTRKSFSHSQTQAHRPIHPAGSKWNQRKSEPNPTISSRVPVPTPYYLLLLSPLSAFVSSSPICNTTCFRKEKELSIPSGLVWAKPAEPCSGGLADVSEPRSVPLQVHPLNSFSFSFTFFFHKKRFPLYKILVPITRSGSLYFFFETKYRFPDISGQWPTSFLVPSFHSGGIRCGPPRDGGWYPDLGGKWEGSERSSTFVAAKFVEVPFLSLIKCLRSEWFL